MPENPRVKSVAGPEGLRARRVPAGWTLTGEAPASWEAVVELAWSIVGLDEGVVDSMGDVLPFQPGALRTRTLAVMLDRLVQQVSTAEPDPLLSVESYAETLYNLDAARLNADLVARGDWVENLPFRDASPELRDIYLRRARAEHEAIRLGAFEEGLRR